MCWRLSQGEPLELSFLAYVDHHVITVFGLLAPQRVAGAVTGIPSINKAIGQVFITALRDAEAGGLDNGAGLDADILDKQVLWIQLPGIPFGDFEAEAFAQEGLSGAEFFQRARPAFLSGLSCCICRKLASPEISSKNG